MIYLTRNEYLISQRSLKKEYYPGYFELSAGGIMGPNEDPFESALRELDEELGIALENKDEMKFFGKLFYEDSHCRCWHYIYYVYYDGEAYPKDGEVIGIQYMSLDQVNEKRNSSMFTPDSLCVFDHFVNNLNKEA